MMVMFATTCDACGVRSEEYTGWPTCRECQEDFCPAHQAPGTFVDADVDQPETCLCVACNEVAK